MPKDNVKWNAVMLYEFIQAMKAEIQRGNFTDSGFKSASWKTILSNFNDTLKMSLTVNQLQNKYGPLKIKYGIFKALCESSGFGWDIANEMPTASDSVWKTKNPTIE